MKPDEDTSLADAQFALDELRVPGLPEREDDGQPCILSVEQQAEFDAIEDEIIRRAMSVLGRRKTPQKAASSAANAEKARAASVTEQAKVKRREGQRRRREREKQAQKTD